VRLRADAEPSGRIGGGRRRATADFAVRQPDRRTDRLWREMGGTDRKPRPSDRAGAERSATGLDRPHRDVGHGHSFRYFPLARCWRLGLSAVRTAGDAEGGGDRAAVARRSGPAYPRRTVRLRLRQRHGARTTDHAHLLGAERATGGGGIGLRPARQSCRMSDPKKSITIHVDAEACPVKAEIYRVAERYGVAVIIVANDYIAVPPNPLFSRIVVDDGFDAADNWIAEHAGPGDIVVTADVPLASRCVKAGATVIGP